MASLAAATTTKRRVWSRAIIIIYKAIWMPVIGEELPAQAEDRNDHNEHAVAV